MEVQWATFLKTYYSEEINKIAARISEAKMVGIGNEVPPSELVIDVLDTLVKFEEGRLYEQLLINPLRAIESAKNALKGLDNIYSVEIENCEIRFVNLPATRRLMIKDIRGRHINKFYAIEGVVKKVSNIVGRYRKIVFECPLCGAKLTKEYDIDDSIQLSIKCSSCRESKMEVKSDEVVVVDYQRISIQELPEKLRGGELPASIDVELYGELLTGKVKPGDRVVVNGVIRHLVKKSKTSDPSRTVYDMPFYVLANSIEVIGKEFEELEITKDDLQKIVELSRRDDIYDLFVRSIAPHIYGLEDIKLAIVLQLFGSPRLEGDQLGHYSKRGDIHILLIGDPGVAKSEILSYVHRIAPRSIYAVGKGSSGAGLTATVRKDELTGGWTIEAGALVLADKGVAIIDEIDKMEEKDRGVLHAAMEQQIVSINKAGVSMTMRSRCAVLASANPKYGRFDKYTPIPKQIDLDPAILSRFDLIFVMFDTVDKSRDTAMADHIVETFSEAMMLLKNPYAKIDNSRLTPPVDPDLFRKYIAYARKNVFPILSKEAMEKIKEIFVELRSLSNDEEGRVAVTPRQLDALLRLSVASARVRLSEIVTIDDVERAYYLLLSSLKEIAIDPDSGNVDIDVLMTGKSSSGRNLEKTIERILEEHGGVLDQNTLIDEVISELSKSGKKIPKETVLKALNEMNNAGRVRVSFDHSGGAKVFLVR